MRGRHAPTVPLSAREQVRPFGVLPVPLCVALRTAGGLVHLGGASRFIRLGARLRRHELTLLLWKRVLLLWRRVQLLW